jgi:DNA-binding transcriptional regulator YiaG
MPTNFDNGLGREPEGRKQPNASPQNRAENKSAKLLWTKESIKSLRQRLGWSQAELSRRLRCSSAEVLLWEAGEATPPRNLSNELLLLSKQAEACSQEVQSAPLAEKICDQKALGQIEFSEIKEEIE